MWFIRLWIAPSSGKYKQNSKTTLDIILPKKSIWVIASSEAASEEGGKAKVLKQTLAEVKENVCSLQGSDVSTADIFKSCTVVVL